jgi:glycosyltransferase involved in cell wall biosynthesis
MGCAHCKTATGTCSNTYEYPKTYFPLFTKYMLRKKKSAFLSQLNMTIVCPSVWLKSNIQKSFLNIFKIETIFNSIDTEIFKPTNNKNELRIKHELPLDKKIILFSASNLNDKSKGIQYILESAEILKDKNYLFLGMGGGVIENHTNIETTGYIYDKQKLADIYALSDVFCFASGAETFLLSAAEALACGIPVVGFDIPVVRELVSIDVGILTRNDSRSLAYSIDKLLIEQDARISMGKDGRDLITKNYSKEIFYSNYKNLYNQQ